MAFDPRLAFPIVAVALTPELAEACPYFGPECGGAAGWLSLTPINADQIPTDGVLLLQTTSLGAPDLGLVDLAVTLDGQPIAGAIEATSVHGVLAWRPSQAWAAGTTHHVTGAVPGLQSYGLGSYDCPDIMIDVDADIIIGDGPGDPLDAPEFEAMENFHLDPLISLNSLACCEGAPPPMQGFGGCGGYYINFDDTLCTPTQAHGYLDLSVTGAPAATGATAKEVAYTLFVDASEYGTTLAPSFTLTMDAPFCATLVATNLATGETAKSKQQCFGADKADQLGMQTLAPGDKLKCPLETCMNTGMAWDPDQCMPISPDTATAGETDGSGGDKGCACDTGGQGPPALALTLFGALALARRRRAPP